MDMRRSFLVSVFFSCVAMLSAKCAVVVSSPMIRSQGQATSVSLLSGATYHLTGGDTLFFVWNYLGDGMCPTANFVHVLNGDTIENITEYTRWYHITESGDHRFQVVRNDGDPSLMGGVLEFTVSLDEPDPILAYLSVSVMLGGCLDSSGVTMRDDLRSLGMIPLCEPFSDLGFAMSGGEGIYASESLFAEQENDYFNVVDWVLVELRDAEDPSLLLQTLPCLVGRAGWVRMVDEVSSPRFTIAPGHYYVAIRHRNHLPVISRHPLPFVGPWINFDLRNTYQEQAFGEEPQGVAPTYHYLWPGNARITPGPQKIHYTGAQNDRDAILERLMGNVNATINGYYLEDLNLDGTVSYTGAQNDRDVIFQTIGGGIPNVVRLEHAP